MPTRHECAVQTCSLNRNDGEMRVPSCDVWDDQQFDFIVIVEKAPIAVCPFIREEVFPIVERYARRARLLGLSPEDLLDDIVFKAFRKKLSAAPPTQANELRQVIKRTYLDRMRSEIGRIRCTGCHHYSAGTGGRRGLCGLERTSSGESHPHFQKELPPHADPKNMRCAEFVDQRRSVAISPLTEPVVRKNVDRILDLQQALAILTAENPLAGALVIASKMDGYTLDELATMTGLTRDQVRYAIEQGLARLRELMGSESGSDE